jgi:hypothetical protein
MAETPPANDSAWQRLVAKVERDPLFLGSALFFYRDTHGLAEEDLAARLECSSSALRRLTLCRLPESQLPRFRDDIRHIAAFASCNPDRLIELVREVLGLWALKGEAAEDDRSLLLAARDRKLNSQRDSK